MFPVVKTERLVLREIVNEDIHSIFTSFSDLDMVRFYGQEPMQTVAEAERLVALFSQNYRENRGIRWGIERKESKGLIGTIGFHAYNSKHKRAEIGYEIHPQHWRHGYAAEAISGVLNYGFNEMNLQRIGAVVFIENEASNNLLKKLGFQREGMLRHYMQQNGMAHDVYMYALLRNEIE